MADLDFFSDEHWPDDKLLLSSCAAAELECSTKKLSSETFLSKFTFGHLYVEKFDQEGYDEIANLDGMEVIHLKEELGMKSGHAKRLHCWLQERKLDSDRNDQDPDDGLNQQQKPARKKRRTSSSSSSSSDYVAPEMKTEDNDDDDDDDDDCVIISSTQIQSEPTVHKSTPGKSPKKRTLPRKHSAAVGRRIPAGISSAKNPQCPNRAISTILKNGQRGFYHPTDHERIYLNIPYKYGCKESDERREKAKKMGARYDPERKKWYVMSDHDASNGYDEMRHLVFLYGDDN